MVSPGLPMAKMRTTKIWADTIRKKICEAPSCRQVIWLAQHPMTGNFMPFDQPPRPERIEREIETGRETWIVDFRLSHFATCPAAREFRRRR